CGRSGGPSTYLVGSVHLHAGGLDDRTVPFEVLMDASFEFVERRDVGLARAGIGQLVRELLALEDRTHLFAQLVDDILRQAGGTECDLPECGFVVRIEFRDAGQVAQFRRPFAARHCETAQLTPLAHWEHRTTAQPSGRTPLPPRNSPPPPPPPPGFPAAPPPRYGTCVSLMPASCFSISMAR